MIDLTKCEDTSYQLKPEGTQIAKDGSHEARVWAILPQPTAGTPLSVQDISQRVGADVAKIGCSKGMKMGWVKHEGNGFVRAVSSKV